MTDETQVVPIRPSSPLHPSEVQALAAELAKSLKLVAPANMGAEQQTVWLHAAVDALEDIRAIEVSAISAELRRKVTRPAQIVPEIANLVHERRQRSNQSAKPASPFFEEREIMNRAQEMRADAKGDRRKIEEAWAWERSARADVGLSVPPIEKPLTHDELDAMPADVRALGFKLGFLKIDVGGKVVES